MLHGILAILLILLVIVTITVMIAVRFVMRGIGRLRSAAHSAMDMNDGINSRKRGNKGRERASGGGKTENARHTRTAEGVTIIDGRDPERAGRKIFAADEGEYVDFEERT